MGKAKRQFHYYAEPFEDGKFLGRVAEDQRLEMPGATEELAIQAIEKLHNEVMQDDQHVKSWLKRRQGGAACQP